MVFEESGEQVVHLPKVTSQWEDLERQGLESILMSFEWSGELAARVGSHPRYLPNVVKTFLESTGMGGEVLGMSERDRGTGTLVSDDL